MKLKCRFEMVDMGDEIIAIPVGETAKEIHGILKLNQSGKEIIEMLQDETTEKAIVDSLTAKYENDRGDIAHDVQLVIEQLKNQELIDD